MSDTADARLYCGTKCQAIGVQTPAPAEIANHVRQLAEQGYCVVRVYSDQEAADVRDEYHRALYNDMPEYLPPNAGGEIPLLVRGGFGALGNSSSFHLPIVRRMRGDAQGVAAAVFKQYTAQRGLDGFRLEQLVDRARVLRTGSEITEELWHRDQTPPHKNPAVQPDDVIFGGWIAFDATQRFSAIKGSHLDRPQGDGRGFARLSKEESAKRTAQKNEVLEHNPNGWFIEIPPGHMLIFQQELIHEVVGGKHKGIEQLRLFTGWRLTRARQSFIKNPQEFFDEQGVTNIKSDQMPDMYPNMPWSSTTITRTGLAKWSVNTFQPYLLEQRSVLSGPSAGETHRLVPQHMYSLYEISIKKAAWDIVQRESNFLESVGHDSFADEERQQRFERAQIIAANPPSVWRERLGLTKADDHWLDRDETVMLPPYAMQEMFILKPLNLT